MGRIYRRGLTTSLGGNLSVLDGGGCVWITPSGADKGSLKCEDICRVMPDGTVHGHHEPSVELPIHLEIYRRRPDVRAVLHAHPPGLVAFSMVGALPSLDLVEHTRRICGEVVLTPYATPGSRALVNHIATAYEKGCDAVVMENHGVCVGAGNMSDALRVFETLEDAAALEICARRLGRPTPLPPSDVGPSPTSAMPDVGSFNADRNRSGDSAARLEVSALVRRAYRRRLFGHAVGTCSARLSDDSFLVTPEYADNANMSASETVLVKRGLPESGKKPSRWAGLHKMIYDQNGDISAILGACPRNAMAYALTDASLDLSVLPETAATVLRIKKIPSPGVCLPWETVAGTLSGKAPVLFCGNSGILVAGASTRRAFERLETLEAAASAMLAARDLGKPRIPSLIPDL